MYFSYSNFLYDSNARKIIERPDIFFGGTISSFSLYKILKPKINIYNAHDLFTNYPDASKSLISIEKEIRSSTIIKG